MSRESEWVRSFLSRNTVIPHSFPINCAGIWNGCCSSGDADKWPVILNTVCPLLSWTFPISIQRKLIRMESILFFRCVCLWRTLSIIKHSGWFVAPDWPMCIFKRNTTRFSAIYFWYCWRWFFSSFNFAFFLSPRAFCAGDSIGINPSRTQHSYGYEVTPSNYLSYGWWMKFARFVDKRYICVVYRWCYAPWTLEDALLRTAPYLQWYHDILFIKTLAILPMFGYDVNTILVVTTYHLTTNRFLTPENIFPQNSTFVRTSFSELNGYFHNGM